MKFCRSPLPFIINLIQLGAVLFIPVILSLYFAMHSGATWDETSYILSGARNAEWFNHITSSSFSDKNIREAWGINIEHPPLAKLGFGLFSKCFEPFLGFYPAARLFNALLFGLLSLSLFVFISARYSKMQAWITVLLLLSFPRLFSYSAIATLDFPLAVFWVLTVLAFHAGETSRFKMLVAFLLFGAANLTKFNGVFVIFPLILWGMFRKSKTTVKNLAWMVVTAALLFFLLWPWLYHDTRNRFENYIQNKTGRIIVKKENEPKPDSHSISKPPSRIPVYYAGTLYKGENYPPPWHYAPFMFVTSIPAGILPLLLLGLSAIQFSRRKNDFVLLSLINLFFILSLYTLPWLPKYGGTRFILPAFVFAAVIAAHGLVFLCDWFFPRRETATKSNGLMPVFVGMFLSVNFIPLVSSNGYSYLYFNNLAGLTGGAEKAGIGFENIPFSDKAIKAVNSLPPGSKIFISPIDPFLLSYLKTTKAFRSDLKLTDRMDSADYCLLFNDKNLFDEKMFSLFEKGTPLWRESAFGVDVSRIYKSASS